MHVYTHIVTYSYIHIHMTHYNSPSAVISSLCVKPTWDARIICYNILQCVYMHIYTCVDMILYIIICIYIYICFCFCPPKEGVHLTMVFWVLASTAFQWFQNRKFAHDLPHPSWLERKIQYVCVYIYIYTHIVYNNSLYHNMS